MDVDPVPWVPEPMDIDSIEISCFPEPMEIDEHPVAPEMGAPVETLLEEIFSPLVEMNNLEQDPSVLAAEAFIGNAIKEFGLERAEEEVCGLDLLASLIN